MLVSLTSTTPDATDLGYLLHKHPDRVRTVDVGFGRAHVFYPQATPHRCTATLYVEVDSFALAKRRKGRQPPGLEPYVNDRPFVASSMLSVALGRLFRTALAGTCDARPELVDRQLDLEIALPVVPVRGGQPVLRRLFEPLGYEVDSTPIALNPQFPQWGDSRCLSVRLSGRHTVRSALEHLFVMLPVLDGAKHYWIGPEEIDKLMRRGGEWLSAHPEADLITHRYLRFGEFTDEARSRLADTGSGTRSAVASPSDSLSDSSSDPSSDPPGDLPSESPGESLREEVGEQIDGQLDAAEAATERPMRLSEQRIESVLDAVRDVGGGRVVDLGCGEGRLLERLADEPLVTSAVGVDASAGALERAHRRLGLDEVSERRRERVSLLQGALTYTDSRLQGFDVATLVEVVEHLDSERLDVFAEAVFGHAAPTAIVLTTPNREYNANFEHLGPSGLRHGDHRFEWTRDEFAEWVRRIAEQYRYSTEISGIGPLDPVHGTPTQMAVFRR